jgi:glycosyltransferase involved in cell wall biosynthesis
LLIAGKGPEEDLLKDLASQLGVSDKIYFLGWVTDTDSFYASLDINTITSVLKPFLMPSQKGYVKNWRP